MAPHVPRTEPRQKAKPPGSGIGTLNERPLHAALKAWIAEEGDEFEVPIDGFVVDIVRGSELIEIQTGSTSILKRKLTTLAKRHRVRLVLPLAARKTIVRIDENGRVERSRLSPKRSSLIDVFVELVSLRDLLGDSNFSVDALLIHEEEIRRPRQSPRRRRQKDWEVHERRLLEVLDHASFHHPADYVGILPASLPQSFTTADLAAEMDKPRKLAQKIAYCLREMGILLAVGRSRRGILYERHFGN